MRPSAYRLVALLALLWLAAPPARAQGRVNYADWRLEWADEFNGTVDTTTLAEHWQFYYPWGRALVSPFESGYYTGRELHAANGVLNMTLNKLKAPIGYRGKTLLYTTPMLFSRHLADSLRPYNCHPAEGFSYGLFEVRLRMPKSPTSAPAFWLFGGVPDEIDVFEGDSHAFASNFHLAPGGYWRPSRTREEFCQCLYFNTDPAANLNEQFHTYGVSWLPDGVIFYFDGVPIRHETRLIPAGCSMAVILNMAALAWATHDTDTMTVDYLRVYRPRHLLPVVPALRPGADFPQTEDAWLPAEIQPGRPDQATYQIWQLASQRRAPQHLTLQLTDNYNPTCETVLPLPLAGRWAPTWSQADIQPELRVLNAGPDSVRWAVRDHRGRLVARGAAAGGGTWLPRWPSLPPGTYALHLRQGGAAMVHPLSIVGRPPGSAPTPEWLMPVPTPAADSLGPVR